jgi:hypothetical protein
MISEDPATTGNTHTGKTHHSTTLQFLLSLYSCHCKPRNMRTSPSYLLVAVFFCTHSLMAVMSAPLPAPMEGIWNFQDLTQQLGRGQSRPRESHLDSDSVLHGDWTPRSVRPRYSANNSEGSQTLQSHEEFARNVPYRHKSRQDEESFHENQPSKLRRNPHSSDGNMAGDQDMPQMYEDGPVVPNHNYAIDYSPYSNDMERFDTPQHGDDQFNFLRGHFPTNFKLETRLRLDDHSYGASDAWNSCDADFQNYLIEVLYDASGLDKTVLRNKSKNHMTHSAVQALSSGKPQSVDKAVQKLFKDEIDHREVQAWMKTLSPNKIKEITQKMAHAAGRSEFFVGNYMSRLQLSETLAKKILRMSPSKCELLAIRLGLARSMGAVDSKLKGVEHANIPDMKDNGKSEKQWIKVIEKLKKASRQSEFWCLEKLQLPTGRDMRSEIAAANDEEMQEIVAFLKRFSARKAISVLDSVD